MNVDDIKQLLHAVQETIDEHTQLIEWHEFGFEAFGYRWVFAREHLAYIVTPQGYTLGHCVPCDVDGPFIQLMRDDEFDLALMRWRPKGGSLQCKGA